MISFLNLLVSTKHFYIHIQYSVIKEHAYIKHNTYTIWNIVHWNTLVFIWSSATQCSNIYFSLFVQHHLSTNFWRVNIVILQFLLKKKYRFVPKKTKEFISFMQLLRKLLRSFIEENSIENLTSKMFNSISN